MRRVPVLVVIAALGAALVVAATAGAMLAGADDRPPSVSAERGAMLYDRLCAACHGTAGDGRGPAAPWLWPRPRDFTRGDYKWRSTPLGMPPTKSDLARAIRFGVPGTSMHAFGSSLTAGDVDALVDVVRGFAPAAFEREAEAIEIGEPPAVDAALLAKGEQLFTSLGCQACHGEAMAGDGPAAEAQRDAAGRVAPPYDMTRAPVRRPRAPGASELEAIYASVATGLNGTPMIGFGGALPEDDLWAVAAYVDSLALDAAAWERPSRLDVDPMAITLDARERLAGAAGTWPGHGAAAEEAVWGDVIPLQGEPPESLAPAQASLDADQCARCHAAQVRQWRGSLHAGAASPGLMAQIAPVVDNDRFTESCQRCHNPLAEQLPRIRPAHRGARGTGYETNPRFDADLRAQGVTCAACHVRGHTRHGPPRLAGTGLLDLPGYPLRELAIYERADFCLGCHQLPARLAVNGKPLLDTYREWLEGPYMRRGIQCQHCHMPNREHTWKGVHDPDTFRQGIDVEAIAARSSRTGAVSVRARVRNVGAGHHLPTTPTPAAWLSVHLIDAGGDSIRGARATERIGRAIEMVDGAWVEHEDTRIPPGESLELAAAWKDGRTAEAAWAVVTVRVHPDDFYEGFYRRRLAGELPDEARALYVEALQRAQGSHYVAVTKRVRID